MVADNRELFGYVDEMTLKLDFIMASINELRSDISEKVIIDEKSIVNTRNIGILESGILYTSKQLASKLNIKRTTLNSHVFFAERYKGRIFKRTENDSRVYDSNDVEYILRMEEFIQKHQNERGVEANIKRFVTLDGNSVNETAEVEKKADDRYSEVVNSQTGITFKKFGADYYESNATEHNNNLHLNKVVVNAGGKIYQITETGVEVLDGKPTGKGVSLFRQYFDYSDGSYYQVHEQFDKETMYKQVEKLEPNDTRIRKNDIWLNS